MAFTTKNPVIRGGKEYGLLGVSLITNPQFKTQSVGAQVVLNLYPYRIDENGNVERPMIEVEGEEGPVQAIDASVNRVLVFGDAYATAAQDGDLAQALGAIAVSLQGFIDAKGL